MATLKSAFGKFDILTISDLESIQIYKVPILVIHKYTEISRIEYYWTISSQHQIPIWRQKILVPQVKSLDNIHSTGQINLDLTRKGYGNMGTPLLQCSQRARPDGPMVWPSSGPEAS